MLLVFGSSPFLTAFPRDFPHFPPRIFLHFFIFHFTASPPPHDALIIFLGMSSLLPGRFTAQVVSHR